MKSLISLTLLFMCIHAVAQDTTYYAKNWIKINSIDTAAYFKVSATKKNKSNNNLDKTYYKSGQIKSSVSYLNGSLDGELLTYWNNGVLKRKDVFANNKLIKGECYDSTGTQIQHFDYEIMPHYPGGETALLKYFQNETRKLKLQKGIKKILASFYIENDGHVSNIIVRDALLPTNTIDEKSNKELIQIITKMEKWNPGSQDGENVRVKYSLPIVID